MRSAAIHFTLLAATLWICGCRSVPATEAPLLARAFQGMTSQDLLRHIKVLASDEFEGRAPGTRGEELTVRYLADQFGRLGLKPGNPDGSFLQKVPLVGFKSDATASFRVGDRRIKLRFPEDCVAGSHRLQAKVTVRDSELVFVGYGVVAPEYGWDDFKNVDVKGKTLVMLINDPPVPDPMDPTRLDEKMFKGKEMTYYGRWTYKYEIASERGAAAAILVHETGPAGYPYDVVVGSWGRENFDISFPSAGSRRLDVESWITRDAAGRLFALAGKDFEALKSSATKKDFKPVSLGATVDFDIENKIRKIESNNVIARLDGSDPRLKDQYVIFSAHWDHLGMDENLKGDRIYNGALDNASGTAALVELARAFVQLKSQLKRSILFLSTTGEEKGLLGARYYVENPLYPLAKTAADINIDGINPWGRTRDIVVIGLGNSTLDDLVRTEARGQDRIIKPDPEPEKGFFYRSDHFEFARHGVPVLYTDAGTEYIGKAAQYAQRKRDQYTSTDYHRVTDEVKSDWDLSGAIEDLQLLFRVGYRVALNEKMPEWKPGAEFAPVRTEQIH
ncbi:MAG TPA: M28 family metallopeptidase [Acidobacteriota bacterium]|nr:M28 family metallopeptidase [Acidobacteriota bacterium]